MWAWVVMILGGGGLLLVVAIAAVIAWAYFDLTKVGRMKDSRDLRARAEKMGEEYLKKHSKGALVIGVVQKGKTYWLGFGQISETNTNPPDAETIFEIGSVTKVFTGVALAQRVADGKLSLDDPIRKYLPAEVTLPTEVQGITLKQLATHTAGLPRLPSNLDLSEANAANPYLRYTTKELYEYLKTAKLDGVPGAKSAYSNLGVGLLGHILELRAGVSYEQLLREQILSPLNMTDTAITASPEFRARLTPGHDAKGNVVSNWDFSVLAPAGGLRSCMADLIKFIEANVSTNQSNLSLALAMAQKTYHESWTGNVGLCWQIQDVRGVYRLHWHNGGTGGYVSFLGFDRESQAGVVLLSNYGDAMVGDSSLDKIGMELLKLATKVSWE